VRDEREGHVHDQKEVNPAVPEDHPRGIRELAGLSIHRVPWAVDEPGARYEFAM
jgi:hypothetical protein